jgi:hypothetical protein
MSFLKLAARVFGTIVLLISPAAHALVPNGDFSEVYSGQLAEWKVGELSPPAAIPLVGKVTVPTRGVSVSLDGKYQQPGAKALKLEGSGSGGDYGLVLSSRFRLMPGYEYSMSIRYRAHGLVRESIDGSGRLAAFIADLEIGGAAGRIGGERLLTSINSDSPITEDHLSNFTSRFRVPPNSEWGVVRLQLVNSFKDAPVTIWIDDVSVEPLDPQLANGGAEAVDQNGSPRAWAPLGSATTSSSEEAHSAKRSFHISHARPGQISGLTATVPIRPDRTYAFRGYVKTLIPGQSKAGGGILEIQFFDQDNRMIEPAYLSSPTSSGSDWVEVMTPKARPPAKAVAARLVVGLRDDGEALFDDLALDIEVVQPLTSALVRRQRPGPDTGVEYAENLLPNGDVEAQEAGFPQGWTYVGKSIPDWTDEQLNKLYNQARPDFSIGRGKGEWTTGVAYSGRRALLNTSIDPPLSSQKQWYGRSPVDGFWLSSAMPCTPGKRYLAGAWIKSDKVLTEMWFGPLEIRFYDPAGMQIPPATVIRSGFGSIPAEAWSYFATLPYTAPKNAATMRLRFGHELAADVGGWGRIYGDNFALWEIPDTVPVPSDGVLGNNSAYRNWFELAASFRRPPYLESPATSLPYEYVWGKIKNSSVGNLFWNPKSDTPAVISLFNLLGEDRLVTVRIKTYDAWGTVNLTKEVPNVAIKALSTTELKLDLPAAGKYGAFYVQADIVDDEASVGSANGRYAVMPPLPDTRGPDSSSVPRERITKTRWENPFAATVLVPISGQGGEFEQQLGELLKTGGFGAAWVRLYYEPSVGSIAQRLASLTKVLAFYEKFDLRTIVQLMPQLHRPISPQFYEAAGRKIGATLQNKAAAVGNWGIEQSNSSSPYRGAGADKITDNDYDLVLAAQYSGLKSVAPDLPVLVGNIATDIEAITVRRMYERAANGKFDGCILNPYVAQSAVVKNTLAVLDAHGDVAKTIWLEEQAEQSSPFGGEARRFGEIAGAESMVRTWLTMLGRFAPRLKVMTTWGVVTTTDENIMMLTPDLQPRPQYVAHAVMSSAIRGATFSGDLSVGDTVALRWRNEDGSVLAVWTNAGEREVQIKAQSGQVNITDIMGNSRIDKATGGMVKVKATVSPLFIFSHGDLLVQGGVN